MIRPSWAVIEQNVQPPKHPRMIWIESLIDAKRRNLLVAVARMRPPRVGQSVGVVHLRLGQRLLGRIDYHRLAIVILDQPRALWGLVSR